MYKKFVTTLIAFTFLIGPGKVSYAMSGCGMENKSAGYIQIAEKETASKAVEIGNKICPVTGEKIDEKTKATYEYEGKIYNFCCAMCVDTFKEDPEKYIKVIEKEKAR